MQKTIKTKSGQILILPTPEEDAQITAAALSDPDAYPITDEAWEEIKHRVIRGRPLSEAPKERISICLSPNVLQKFRSSGNGWQTRIDAVLQHWLKRHDASQIPKL